MKNYKFLSVIMVIALCFGIAQSVDAKKKKSHKRAKTEKTHKKNRVTELNVEVYEDVPEEIKTIDELVDYETDSDEIFKSAAHMPSFPGGDAALMNFISKNIRYPRYPHETCAQGKVIVQFVVEKNGKVGEVKVARGVDPDLDKEAVRVCKMLPAFTPGRNAVDEPVRVWYTLPITFKLTGNESVGPTGDYAKDARQAGEKILEILNRDIKSEDDLEQMEKAMDAVQKIYEDFYREKGDEELKKFNEELNNLEYDPVLGKKIEEAMNKLQEKISKLLNE